MSISSLVHRSAKRAGPVLHGSSPSDRTPDQQLCRWGGVAGLAGVALMVGAFVVVGALGLPDASDVETLTRLRRHRVGAHRRALPLSRRVGAVRCCTLLVLHRLLRTGPSGRCPVRHGRGRVRPGHHGGQLPAARFDLAAGRSVHRVRHTRRGSAVDRVCVARRSECVRHHACDRCAARSHRDRAARRRHAAGCWRSVPVWPGSPSDSASWAPSAPRSRSSIPGRRSPPAACWPSWSSTWPLAGGR